MISAEDIRVKEELIRKKAFAVFMDSPATRLMVSMIPAAEKAEVLQTLLQECFNVGFASGGAALGLTMIEQMMRPREPK